jgi:O-antigen/teichoic acid export membrane protein
LGLRPGTLARRLVLQSAGSFGLNGATFVFNFVMALLLSRLIGASGYGAYSFATAWALFLAVPALLGLPQLVIRETASYRVRKDWGRVRGLIRRVNELGLAASLVVAGVAGVTCWLLDWPKPPLFVPTLIGLGLVPLVTVISLRQGAMLGFGVVVLARAPEALVTPVVTICLVLVFSVALAGGLTASWAVGAQVLGALLAAIVGIYLLRRTLPREAKTAPPVYENRLWLRGAVPFLLTGAISSVNFQSGTVLTGAIAGSQAAGIYGVAVRVSGVLPFLAVAVVPALMPAVAELYAQRDSERLQELLTRTARVVFFLSAPLGVGVMLFAGPLLAFFGSGFEGGATTLRILCVGQIIALAAGFGMAILAMTGAAGETAKAAAAAAVVNVALGVALIPMLGANGAAIASTASVILMNVMAANLLWRRRRLFSPAIRLGLLAR